MEFVEAFERETKGITGINVGQAIRVCTECQQHFDIEPDDPILDEIELQDWTDFSSCQCDTCSSLLGGSRHIAHGFGLNKDGSTDLETIYHLEVCIDCVMYIANGDLPEGWEG